jgi:hypothetical protein
VSLPIDEELRLLRELWDIVWNQVADYDYGDHSGMSWEDQAKVTEAASALEGHYAKHGWPLTTEG